MTSLSQLRRRVGRRLAAAPAERIAAGVWLIRGGFLRSMNVYLLEDEGRVTVFDAGEKGMVEAIIAAAEPLGGVERVVLSHGDTDHRGAAPGLSAVAPLAVPSRRRGGGTGQRRAQLLAHGSPSAGRAHLHGFLHDHVWDGGPVTISGTLREGDAVAAFEVVELPGHAPGLIGLWRASDRVALVSDCAGPLAGPDLRAALQRAAG